MEGLNSTNIERVVVRGTNWVGDAVMTVPALRRLRQLLPDARITLATRSWARGLFAGADFIDEVMVHEGTGLRSVVDQVRQWRAPRFDLGILFPNSLESALVASLARVPVRIGYATEGRQRLLTHPLALPTWRNLRHEVFYYLNVIDELGSLLGNQTGQLEPDDHLQVGDSRQSAALRFLREKGVDDNRTIVALCPGSTNSRAKRWPEDRYAALGDRLVEECGAEVVLVGSTGEIDVSREVSNRMRGEPIVLTGETDLELLVAVLSLVDLVVTNDTGPAHISSALGRPTLVIFGPTNPVTTRPFSTSGEVIREPPECAPCMLRDCPIDHRCMTAISPDDVFARAAAILGKGKFAEQPSPLGRVPVGRT